MVFTYCNGNYLLRVYCLGCLYFRITILWGALAMKNNHNPVLGAFLKGSGFSRSQDERLCCQRFHYVAWRIAETRRYGFHKILFCMRLIVLVILQGLKNWDDSFEAMHRYYQKMVDIRWIQALQLPHWKFGHFQQKMHIALIKHYWWVKYWWIQQWKWSTWHMIRLPQQKLNAELKAKAAALALSTIAIKKA